jgi:hypothetical protein
MKKFGTLCLLLSLFTTGLIAQSKKKGNPTTPASTPVADTSIQLTEESYSFGKIPQGKPVHHEFSFINNGTTPVKLTNVQASCGCTTPEWDKEKTYQPGENGVIKVGYNAASEGMFQKSITIVYSETKMKVISISGEVWKTPAASAPANQGANSLKEEK